MMQFYKTKDDLKIPDYEPPIKLIDFFPGVIVVMYICILDCLIISRGPFC